MRTPAASRRTPVAARAGALAVAAALLVGLAVAPSAGATTVGSTTTGTGAATSVDPQVDALLTQRLVNPRIGSDVGLVVIDAASGDLVSEHDADRLFLPASNMKIVTAVDVLATLGAEARLTTRVRPGGVPNDVILEGGGDPLLTTGDLQALAGRTAKGLAKDTPVVVHVDADLFPAADRAPGWTTGYLPYVAAPVQALARLGDYSRDPSTNAARIYVQKLRSLGFRASLSTPANADDNGVVLAEAHSTVGDAVSVMLSHSENNVAEVLFRQVALATGVAPTWEGGRQAATAVLAGLGVDASGMRLLDGSGLSRKDRLSPRFLAEVLRLARVRKPAPFAVMFTPQALPVSGETGTLATAFGRYVTPNSRCARGDVHAKTGSLFDVIALSGVATTTTGGERLFSILVNDFPQQYSELSGRQVLDGLTATITGCWA